MVSQFSFLRVLGHGSWVEESLANRVAYVSGSSKKIAKLTGEFDKHIQQLTASRTESRAGLIGTDLGSSLQRDGRIYFLFGDSGPTDWYGPFPLVADGVQVSGVSGIPGFIQSRFGTKGNFEIVAPLAAGGLAHYWRDNDTPGLPWHGPIVFGAGDKLLYFWRDSKGWNGPFPFVPYGHPVSGVSGNPAFIQSKFGSKGNFEFVVPLAAGGLAHFWRDNDNPSLPTHGPIVFGASAGKVDAAAFIQSNFGVLGDFEVIARVGSGLVFFWRDSGPALQWNGPFALALSDG